MNLDIKQLHGLEKHLDIKQSLGLEKHTHFISGWVGVENMIKHNGNKDVLKTSYQRLFYVSTNKTHQDIVVLKV